MSKDAFDQNPQLAAELVLRIANPELGHPSMDWIIRNRSLVELLLYRHYQRHGGLILPPRQDAVAAMQSHESRIAQIHIASPDLHVDYYPRIVLPNWYDDHRFMSFYKF